MEAVEYLPGFFMYDCCAKLLVFYIFVCWLAKGLIRVFKAFLAEKSNYSCVDCKDLDCPGKICYLSRAKFHQNIEN